MFKRVIVVATQLSGWPVNRIQWEMRTALSTHFSQVLTLLYVRIVKLRLLMEIVDVWQNEYNDKIIVNFNEKDYTIIYMYNSSKLLFLYNEKTKSKQSLM